MKSITIVGLWTILIWVGLIGTAAADIEWDCPSNTDRPTVDFAYAHSQFDSSTNTMTYLIDTIDKPGTSLIEYCVYPTPGFTGSNSDLMALYSGWSIDRPGSTYYFGFDSRDAPWMPFNGDTNVQMGKAIYTEAPSDQLILLHIADTEECIGGSSCWRKPSTSPLPTPTITPTPTPEDTEPPSQPLCPLAIATGPTAIYLSWWASTDNVAIAGYRIYRSIDNINFYYLITVTDITHTDIGLTTGQTYYYRIEAVDTSGNPSIPSDVVYATPRDIQAPMLTVPSDIVTEATSPSGTIVTFSASAIDDIDGSITPICDHSSGSTFPLGLTTITCTATDNTGNTNSAIFTIRVVDTTPPTVPTGLNAVPISSSRIDLSWTASYDAVGIIRYWIYRSIDNINFDAIATMTGTTFQNTGLMSDMTYYYYIIAIDSANNPSAASVTVSATTLSPSPPPTPTPTPTPGPGPTPTPTPTPTPGDMPPTLTVPTDTTAEATSPNGATITFSVSAFDNEDGFLTPICVPTSGSIFPLGSTVVICSVTDNAGNEVSAIFTVRVVDTTPPTAPSGLTATAISDTRIDLSWTASYDIVGVTGYWIYRSLDDISFNRIGTSVGTTFINTGRIPNTTYYYYVKAIDAAANPSNPSNTASASTFPQPPIPPPGPTPSPTETTEPTPTPTTTVSPCETGNTGQGQNVEISPMANLGIMFDTVLQCGETTAAAYYDNQWTALPSTYTSLLFYDIDTTSIYDNYITISITYSASSNIDENSIRLFHYENGNWIDVTITLDTTSNIVTGRVASLSPFAAAGTSSSSGSGGTGSAGSARFGSSFDIIGIMMLAIILIAISILNLTRMKKDE